MLNKQRFINEIIKVTLITKYLIKYTLKQGGSPIPCIPYTQCNISSESVPKE